ncbi:MAG: M20/M25/M40 family metallo-hydrolase [Planctomycetota bacterium]
MRISKRQTFTIVITTCVILELLVNIVYQGPLPRTMGDSTDADNPSRFSADAAMAIHELVFPDAPHTIGSVENSAVRSAIVDRLTADGWIVERAVPFDVRLRNRDGLQKDVVVTSPGNIVAYREELMDRSARPLIMVSHFDSCPFGPGAGDAGGCVAAIIEAARLLTRDASRLRRPVWLLLTDGEENGLDGANHFVKHHSLMASRPIVLNFDARGTAGPVAMFETHAGNLEMIERLANRFQQPRVTGSLFTAIYRMMPNGTDFTIFRDAGCSGLNFALIDGAHRYHRPDDSRANLDRRSVQHFGDTALSVAREIASSDHSFDNNREDGLFFDLLGQSVFVIPLWWNQPLRLFVLFLAEQIYGRPLMKDKPRKIRTILTVWGTMAAVLPMMAVLGFTLSRSILGTSILPVPFVSWGHWISLFLWIVSLSACALWMHFMLCRHDARIVWNAFWLAHAATNMVVSILLPEFSYLLFIPALAAMLITLFVEDVLARTTMVTCFAAVLLVPLHHLIAIALGPAGGLMLLPAFSLLSMPLLPAFSRETREAPVPII